METKIEIFNGIKYRWVIAEKLDLNSEYCTGCALYHFDDCPWDSCRDHEDQILKEVKNEK